ncbi:MAG: hypothetical protein SF052_21755 [Bacteroidia bacterium]|nr:hypothetical protein [Bacteroidia bacterium]
MFSQITNLTSGNPKTNARFEIEPHVTYYDILRTDKRTAILPFQVATIVISGLIAMGFVSWLFQQENPVTYFFIGIVFLLAILYLPYVFFYLSFFSKEEQTRVEIDTKHGYIKYTNPRISQNLLFHRSQITFCQLNRSLLFPFKIDFITLDLKGGRRIHISSLVVDPRDMIRDLSLPYELRSRVFNFMP